MSDQKIKVANDKVPMDLLPSCALKGPARVFGYGARKYAMGNYLTADDSEIARRYIGGVLRHLGACQMPNGLYTMESIAKRDDESGLPEIDHAITGLLMLRALAVKHGAIPADPGLGNDPLGPPAAQLDLPFHRAAGFPIESITNEKGDVIGVGASTPTPVAVPKVGDRVRGIGGTLGTRDAVGTLAEIDSDPHFPYRVAIDNGTTLWVKRVEIADAPMKDGRP